MKKLRSNEYYCYGESNYRLGKTMLERVDVDWICKDISKKQFISTLINSRLCDSSPNWISERLERNDNEDYLRLLNDNTGKILAIVSGYTFNHPQGKIMKILDVMVETK